MSLFLLKIITITITKTKTKTKTIIAVILVKKCFQGVESTWKSNFPQIPEPFEQEPVLQWLDLVSRYMTDNSNASPKTLSLELGKRLTDEQIVRSYFYDLKTSDLILQLNHEYSDKDIASVLKLDEWESSVKKFEDKLTLQEISSEHMVMILDTLAANSQAIADFAKSKVKGKGKKRSKRDGNDDSGKDEKEQQEFMAFKYSNEGKADLHEAVMLAGKSTFLKYDTKANKIVSIPKIVEEIRTITSPYIENYPGYSPIEFSSVEEVERFFETAKNSTIETLYLEAKKIASDYNDQTEEQINLLAIDIISSYFQDKFPAVHYDIVTGGNGSGKSAYGITFVSVGYRPAYLMDINAVNIFRILGSVEIGQCTLVLDEADKICDNPDLVSILKSGYSPIGRVSRVNDVTRQPEFFRPFCFKIILAESIPNIRDAKGFRDRSFETSALRGSPRFDIKEDLEAEIQGNVQGKSRLDRLINFKKRMLTYRLLHFKDSLPDIDVGFGGREKELVKPIIQLFYGSRVQREVESTLEYFLNLRNEGKGTGLEAALYPMVWDMVINGKTGGKIYHRDLWAKIIGGEFPGASDKNKPNEYQSEDFGTIYRQTVGTILEHTFGGKREHAKKGNTFTFDPPRLDRVGKSYNIKSKIKTRLVISHSNNKGEQVNTVNTIGEAHTPKNDKKKGENGSDGRFSRGNSSSNNTEKGGEPSVSCSPSSPVHPSQEAEEQAPNFDSVSEELEDIYEDGGGGND